MGHSIFFTKSLMRSALQLEQLGAQRPASALPALPISPASICASFQYAHLFYGHSLSGASSCSRPVAAALPLPTHHTRLVHGYPHPRAAKRARLCCASAASSTSIGTTSALASLVPPDSYDLRTREATASRAFVASQYPQLLDLVDEGTLLVYQRPADYVERREDGYREPETIFVLGTAHVSAKSVLDVQRLVAAVQPQVVAVELCKGRAATLLAPEGEAAASNSAAADATAAAAPSVASTANAAAKLAAPQQTNAPQATVEVTANSTSGDAGSPDIAASIRGPVNPLGLTGNGGAGGYAATLLRSLSLGGQSAFALRLLMAGVARRASGAFCCCVHLRCFRGL